MVKTISRPSQVSLLVTYQVCQTRCVTRLVLASTSPARLALLRAGGIEPATIAPEVDEDAVAARAEAMGLIANTADMVQLLAKAKAEAVVANEATFGSLIIGCDSSLEFEGQSLGKPHDPEVAIARWKSMRGKVGYLHTGHWLIDNRNPVAGALPPATGESSVAKVHFADISDAEIEAYVATGEPLKVAGAFTIDGLGGAFLEKIEGDTHTVVGLSLPTLRLLTLRLGVEYTSLWNL
jgi:septum formation protein